MMFMANDPKNGKVYAVEVSDTVAEPKAKELACEKIKETMEHEN